MKPTVLALVAAAALTMPALASAQSSSTININGEVPKKCMLGAPASTELQLGTLTGADGRLDSSKTGSAVLQTTTISDAWCNTPSRLEVEAQPLVTVITGYNTPAGFTRTVSYDALLEGWPAAMALRPFATAASDSTETSTAYANDLVLSISRLGAVAASGNSDDNSAFLEAGQYRGSVTVTLSVKP